jgi:hypothetical protein
VGTHKVYRDRKVIREREGEKNLEGLGLVAGSEYVDDRSASQRRRRSLPVIGEIFGHNRWRS